MKNVALLLFIFVFLFLSIVPSFVSPNAAFSPLSRTFAKEEAVEEATVSADSSMTEGVKYDLPYPGILPDNPLYFLKMIRDRIVGFLISDPLKKAEFDLLQADKRLNAGIYLLDKNKDKNARLAQSTISKGEDYFEKAIEKVDQAKKQGLDTKDILRRLSEASKKHQEVLQSLEAKAGPDLKDDYVFLQSRTKNFESRVESLRLD